MKLRGNNWLTLNRATLAGIIQEHLDRSIVGDGVTVDSVSFDAPAGTLTVQLSEKKPPDADPLD